MAQNAARDPWPTGDEKRAYVRRMFADISPTYDFMNSAMSLRFHHRWRADAVKMLSLERGETAADICCGTGDFGRPLRRALGPEGRIVGIDFCRPMLTRARRKPFDLKPSLGDACCLPLRTESVDAVTVGWGIRNLADIPGALREIYRVLKPGGRFVMVDMSQPRFKPLRALSRVLFRTVVPALGALVGKRQAYAYLPESASRFASREALARMIRDAGFEKVNHRDRFFGNICIQWSEK